jgi:alkanesulfonate monooxygenase SsuD/methylene tetrahydromethanopterin reductase-like flavin-dependent oxidoreductase (luciferase family)
VATRRVALTPFVTCTNFRNPALIAKMAATVDEMSGGRLVLGLGAGWLRSEFDAFGFPFDHRVSRFAEAIQIIHGLLRHGQVDFAGEYYQTRGCELLPRGPREGGPPILVGTTGPRMLRLTARYANAWDTNFRPLDQLPALQAALDDACGEEGRDPATVERSASVTVAAAGEKNPYVMAPQVSGTTEEMTASLRAYADLGFSQVVVWLTPCTLAGIDAFAPVLEQLRRDA